MSELQKYQSLMEGKGNIRVPEEEEDLSLDESSKFKEKDESDSGDEPE